MVTLNQEAHQSALFPMHCDFIQTHHIAEQDEENGLLSAKWLFNQPPGLLRYANDRARSSYHLIAQHSFTEPKSTHHGT